MGKVCDKPEKKNRRQVHHARRIARLTDNEGISTEPQDIGWALVAGIGAICLVGSPINVVSSYHDARSGLGGLSESNLKALWWLFLGFYLLVRLLLLAGFGWAVMIGAWRRTRWGFSTDQQAQHATQEEANDAWTISLKTLYGTTFVAVGLIVAVAVALLYQLTQP